MKICSLVRCTYAFNVINACDLSTSLKRCQRESQYLNLCRKYFLWMNFLTAYREEKNTVKCQNLSRSGIRENKLLFILSLRNIFVLLSNYKASIVLRMHFIFLHNPSVGNLKPKEFWIFQNLDLANQNF